MSAYREPYSRDELRAMLPVIQEEVARRLRAFESEYPEARPLPPLFESEAATLLLNLLDKATYQLLTPQEAFLGGQLLNQFKQAVTATVLGKKSERYYCFSEEQLHRVLRGEDPLA